MELKCGACLVCICPAERVMAAVARGRDGTARAGRQGGVTGETSHLPSAMAYACEAKSWCHSLGVCAFRIEQVLAYARRREDNKDINFQEIVTNHRFPDRVR